jgi:hypothetical protein
MEGAVHRDRDPLMLVFTINYSIIGPAVTIIWKGIVFLCFIGID